MSLPSNDLAIDGCHPSSQPDGLYEPSIASSTSSTQTSVFSDAASEQSSIASSLSDDFRTGQDDGRSRYCASAHTSQNQLDSSFNDCVSTTWQPQQQPQQSQQPTYADVTSVPAPQRQHPRRSSLARNQKPPPLVRQGERKLNFVDNLVDSATQMVEVIWPLSMVPCRPENSSGRGVLPLRTYIEETLRRSRTSYSTLQVALYYLILIKPYVPPRDFTMAQSSDCQASRSLMCGRRMFLAALILASKYLQDRNYSAKAWSKMSGLKVCEINANERVFLKKISWKLHVAKPIFDRWTEIVLKYTPNTQPPSPSGDPFAVSACWRTIIPILTPELDTVPLPERGSGSLSPPALTPCDFGPSLTPTPTQEKCARMEIDLTSQDNTPTPSSVCPPPRFLEPRPTMLPPTPALVRMGPLPTPQMTPSIVASSTPAASACGSRRPSICGAMSLVQRSGFNRCVNDEFPMPSMEKFRMPSRRPSIASTVSTRSSPESMISDLSRSSRASSISSVTTVSTNASCVAPPRTNLARMATTRNVRLPSRLTDAMEEDKEVEGSAARPITIAEEDDDDSTEASMPDFTLNEKKMHAPHRHSKHALHHQHPISSVNCAEKSRKRHRTSRGGRRSDLYDEVRFQLEEDQDDMVVDLVDSDEDMSSPSPAAVQAASLLRRSESFSEPKEAQPPPALYRHTSARVPMQKHDGSKRTCCATKHDIFKASSLYMEVA